MGVEIANEIHLKHVNYLVLRNHGWRQLTRGYEHHLRFEPAELDANRFSERRTTLRNPTDLKLGLLVGAEVKVDIVDFKAFLELWQPLQSNLSGGNISSKQSLPTKERSTHMNGFVRRVLHDYGADCELAKLHVFKYDVRNASKRDQVKDILKLGIFLNLFQFFLLSQSLLLGRGSPNLGTFLFL